jgi:hypothetical protein
MSPIRAADPLAPIALFRDPASTAVVDTPQSRPPHQRHRCEDRNPWWGQHSRRHAAPTRQRDHRPGGAEVHADSGASRGHSGDHTQILWRRSSSIDALMTVRRSVSFGCARSRVKLVSAQSSLRDDRGCDHDRSSAGPGRRLRRGSDAVQPDHAPEKVSVGPSTTRFRSAVLLAGRAAGCSSRSPPSSNRDCSPRPRVPRPFTARSRWGIPPWVAWVPAPGRGAWLRRRTAAPGRQGRRLPRRPR